MESIFDSEAFNSALFHPRPESSPVMGGARDLMVDVSEGVQLHLRLHHHPEARATVLLFHGNGEIVADYDALAAVFAHRAHARLAVVDYRGFGQSTGAPTMRTVLSDAGPVLDAVLDAIGDHPLVIMGRSLGSAAAAELSQRRPPRCRGFVFESGISDVYGLIRRRGIEVLKPLAERDLAVFCPLRKFARCDSPTLVLHGEGDTMIVPDEARATFEALRTHDKRLVMIPGRGHNDLSWHPNYWQALGDFVLHVTRLPTPANDTAG